MKKRWMKSVIEASKQDIPAMPFERCARCAKRDAAAKPVLRKTA